MEVLSCQLEENKRNPRHEKKQLCLNFIRSTCKRGVHCKFAHPDKQAIETEYVGRGNCPVWMITGFCKFGKECALSHPPLKHYRHVLPPVTAKYEKQKKRREERLARKQLQMISSINERLAMEKLADLFDRLTTEDFELMSTKIIELLETDDSIQITNLAGLILSKTVDNSSDEDIYIFSTLCKKIHLSKGRHSSIIKELIPLWFAIFALKDDEPYENFIQRSINAIQFLFGLLREDLIDDEDVLRRIATLIEGTSMGQILTSNQTTSEELSCETLRLE